MSHTYVEYVDLCVNKNINWDKYDIFIYLFSLVSKLIDILSTLPLEDF